MSLERLASVLHVAGGEAISTRDVAAGLKISASAASHVMTSLRAHGLASRIRPGLWLVGEPPTDRFALAAALTAPSPAYVSFTSALSYHGLIDQLPREITVASTGRPKLIRTEYGDYRIHRIAPPLFGGWEPKHDAWMATPEKALFDIAYVAAVRGQRTTIPELDLPQSFDRRKIDEWLKRVPSKRVRTIARLGVERLLERATR